MQTLTLLAYKMVLPSCRHRQNGLLHAVRHWRMPLRHCKENSAKKRLPRYSFAKVPLSHGKTVGFGVQDNRFRHAKREPLQGTDSEIVALLLLSLRTTRLPCTDFRLPKKQKPRTERCVASVSGGIEISTNGL